jgi:hypothetical protein
MDRLRVSPHSPPNSYMCIIGLALPGSHFFLAGCRTPSIGWHRDV